MGFLPESFASEPEEIDTLRWPAMPDPCGRGRGARGIWIWPQSRIRALEQRNPSNAHGDGYLLFPFALSVFDTRDRHILTVALERTDYRLLSLLAGVRLRDLAGTAGGYLSEVTLAVYRADDHKDLGPYEGLLDDESAIHVLLETVAEELDLWEDPLFRPDI